MESGLKILIATTPDGLVAVAIVPIDAEEGGLFQWLTLDATGAEYIAGLLLDGAAKVRDRCGPS